MSTPPTLVQLAKFHGMNDEPPRCYRCKTRAPRNAWRNCGWWFRRAHIIKPVYGGSCGPDNVYPLCLWCFKVMPDFKQGQEQAALDWVKTPLPPIEDTRAVCLALLADEGADDATKTIAAQSLADIDQDPQMCAEVSNEQKRRVNASNGPVVPHPRQ